MIPTGATLSINPPVSEPELPVFCTPENGWLIAGTATALVISAIAIGLLFTPVGAGVVGMGLLIGAAVLTGVVGVACLGVLIHKHLGHVESCERIVQENTTLRVRASASAAIREFPNALSRIKCQEPLLTVLYRGSNSDVDTYYKAGFSKELEELMQSMSTDFSMHRSKDHFAFLIGEYLRLLFLGTADQEPRIRLRPDGIHADEWKRLLGLAHCADYYENAKSKGESYYQRYDVRTRMSRTQGDDEKIRNNLIQQLRDYFGTQPQCVKEYLFLHRMYCVSEVRGKKILADVVKVLFHNAFIAEIKKTFEFGTLRDEMLASFIITHIDELFPQEYEAFKNELTSKYDSRANSSSLDESDSD